MAHACSTAAPLPEARLPCSPRATRRPRSSPPRFILIAPIFLRKRVRAANVKVIQADATQLPVEGEFDRVLVDVPCSGTGTLARNPEIKWRLKPEDLDDLHKKQVAILRAALQHLAPGRPCRLLHLLAGARRRRGRGRRSAGRASRLSVYSTSATNSQRLRASGELAWEDLDSLVSGKYLRTIPGVHPCDGFFAAVIERVG